MQLQRARTTLQQLDIAPLILTFEALPFAAEYVVETELRWPLMVDVDRELYRAYSMHRARWRDLWGVATMRVYAREALDGRLPRWPRADTVQQGGDVLINPDGIVRYLHVGRGPADRPSVEHLLAVRQRGY